jgi:hypothetical protein
VVTIDESGDDALADPQFPIFGLGACAVLLRDYQTQIGAPWLEMKDAVFGGRQLPLHAADLRHPTAHQINGLNQFFGSRAFARLGTFLTKTALLGAPLTRYQTVSHVLGKQISRVAAVLPCDSVALIVESSEKYDEQFYEVFGALQLRVESENHIEDIPIELYRARKSPLIPSLEVADFVAHTAGTATRAALRGQIPADRPDMAHVFGLLKPPMSQYMRIEQSTGARNTP